MQIAVASGKGGTGKTLVSTCLLRVLGDKNSVLIDTDVEEPNAGLVLGQAAQKTTPVSRLVPDIDSRACNLCGEAEDAATMQINLVYLEAALDYAKEIPRSKARVGEKGFTEDYTPTDYNKERSEALDALRNAVNSLKKKVKELPPEETLAKPEAAPAPTSKKGKKKKEEPTEEPTEPPVGDTEDDVDTDDVDEEGDADLDDAINALLSELGGDGKGKGKGKASSSKLKDKASKAKRSADVFRNLLDNELSDDIDMDAMESDLDNLGDFDFQSDTRGPRFSQEISLYDRVRAVIEQHHPEALPELERIKDDQVKIRFLVHRLEMEARDAADELDASADRMLSEERKMRSQRAEDLLAPEKERKRITAQKMEQYHKVFQGIREAIDNKVTLTPEQLVQLENIFIEYNEVMAPNSLEDSVPVRVMRKLGLLLDMGIDVRTDPLTGQRVPMYYWSVRGNIATYGKELRSLSALYNESTKSYEWTSLNPRNSPLAKLLEKFGGEEYVKEAQGTEIPVSDDARGAITGFPRRTDVDRSGRSLYTLGTRGNPKQLLITKGIRTSSKPKMAVSRNTWYKRLKDHQKEGVKLALEALENYGAFILADGTGAGKTAQMLAVAEHYSRQGKKVLLVLHNAESFEEAFLRDAEVLGIPKTQLTFLTASEGSEKRGRMAPGKINAIAYNYLSLIKKDPALAGWPLEEKIERALGTRPDLVIFDEAHNMKNVAKDDNFKAAGGTELSRISGKAMFATATVAEDPEQLPYLEKLGFMKRYERPGDNTRGLKGFMAAMGVALVVPKDTRIEPFWRAHDLEYSRAQLDLFYNELADAGFG